MEGAPVAQAPAASPELSGAPPPRKLSRLRKAGAALKAPAVAAAAAVEDDDENAVPNRAGAAAATTGAAARRADLVLAKPAMASTPDSSSPADGAQDSRLAAPSEVRGWGGVWSARHTPRTNGTCTLPARAQGGSGDNDAREAYYDEEDELEQYFGRRYDRAGGDEASGLEGSEGGEGGAADSQHSDSHAAAGSDDDDDDVSYRAGSAELGGDLNADTQRILRGRSGRTACVLRVRVGGMPCHLLVPIQPSLCCCSRAETASRDRLGKGAPVEIRPLSSILDKIRERQAQAIARAPKPTQPNVGSFDDILAEATAKAASTGEAAQTAAADNDGAGTAGVAAQEREAAEPPAAGSPQAEAPVRSPFAAKASKRFSEEREGTPEAAEGALSGAPGTPADDDLMIVSSDDEGAPPARVVELPSTVKKLRPLGVYASTVRAAGWDGARCCTGAW